MKRTAIGLGMSLLLALVAACTSHDIMKAVASKDQYTALADSENANANLHNIQLDSYSKEVGASLTSPKYQSFSANSSVVIEGSVKKYQGFKSRWVWIEVKSKKDGPGGQSMSYYAPIQEGKFKQTILLFNGKGSYSVKVSLPSDTAENYYYTLASFQVKNVNSAIERDVAYYPDALKSSLQLDPSLKGYMDEKGFFTLKGKINEPGATSVLVAVKKGTESTNVKVPVTNGTFSQSIPLYYGKGVHEIQVMAPDHTLTNYYNEAADLRINNLSDAKYQPIEFSSDYDNRGYTLDSPEVGGTKTNLSFRISGSINPKAPDYKETNILFVNTKKGNLTAMYAIPVKNNHFDAPFYLRFGPGKYEVTVMAPDPFYQSGNVMHYDGLASFEMENTNPKDERYILPSKGIQSDDPEIKQLAEQLTKGKSDPKEKAQSIYEYVAKTINYDVNKLNFSTFKYDDSAIKTLHEKKGVCEDYAYLTIALLRASGIEAQMVTGYAGQNHAWIEAKVNGRWLTMDPTWGSGYIQNNQFVKKFTMEFFDPNPAKFSQTHTRQGVQY